MTKMLPYSPEYSTNYYFQVVLKNPDKEAIDKGLLCYIYSYIDDISIVAAIVKSCTKYEFTIRPAEPHMYERGVNVWSINQACGYLRRLRFIKKSVVKRTRTIEWNEEVEEEL